MVRINKTLQAKHTESLSVTVRDFRDAATSISLPLLPQRLSTFPTVWPFPRGDLYHWIPLLNRFDTVLEQFCNIYKLNEGPQTIDFACTLLESEAGDWIDRSSGVKYTLESLGYAEDGDRRLIESILVFSRMLLQNCGNRSIYASSAHLSNLLNSTSLSLLENTLLLSSELAKRYQAALKRMNIPGRQISNALLANHYNIELDRVLQLALPFTKTLTIQAEATQPNTPATPTVKGKEKIPLVATNSTQKSSTIVLRANDLVSIVKGGNGVYSSPKSNRNEAAEISWAEWGDVKVTYYPKPSPEHDATGGLPATASPVSNIPLSPTPMRRSSNLAPQAQRSTRPGSSEESPSPATRTVSFPPIEEAAKPNFKVIEIPAAKLKSDGIHVVLRNNLSGLPNELQYELLTQLRAANALTTSLDTRRQLLAIRLLAITNLAYIHSEATFHETVLKQDSEEPRRLQLAYQLAELVHPPTEGEAPVPRPLQVLAFGTLDALLQHQSRTPDVCAALNTNVNHGVLLYVIRKAVAELGQGDMLPADNEWRESLFSLLSNLAVTARVASDLVTAGLITILVEVLGFRNPLAECYHPIILALLDTIMFSARDAFQTLVNADGLGAVSNLIVFEVNTAAKNAASGNGMPTPYRSASTDYEIPFFQQQTLKWLFKFIHHMMSTAGGYGGNFDRLLRNLIDSPPLLASLRQIISNAKCFGSIVWTNAVSILNDFINNEPTSFAVIAEAGLSKALLEAVTGSTIISPPKVEQTGSSADETGGTSAPETSPSHPSEEEDDDDDDDSDDEASTPVERPTLAVLQAPREGPLARGILPTLDTINMIPQAFGAICLNNAGMKMFQASRALDSFFEIFESPEHVKCMDNNKELPSSLGSTFDELVRHHPPLKSSIMNSLLMMVARVSYLCKTKAEKNNLGAKLWTVDASGSTIIANDKILQTLDQTSATTKGKEKAYESGTDIDMKDADTTQSLDPGTSMTPYVAAVAHFLSAMLNNTSVRSEFGTRGGIEYVLDLAESPCLARDASDSGASHGANQILQNVISVLAESKPHLTIPSLLRRTQAAAEQLIAFSSHSETSAFFAPFVNDEARQSADLEFLSKGTSFAKALVNLHSLLSMLHACLQASSHNHRGTNTGFNQLNVADYYIRLVHSLGPLLSACLKEKRSLRKLVPDYADYWDRTTGIKDSVLNESIRESLEHIEYMTDLPNTPDSQSVDPLTTVQSTAGVPATEEAAAPQPKKRYLPSKSERETAYFKNFQALRPMLSKLTPLFAPFFQTLGKALVTKRNPEPFQTQSHAAIAEALATTILAQLAPIDDEMSIENYNYWIGILEIIPPMLIESSRSNERSLQTITIVLQSFKDQGGFAKLNHILEVFTNEIRSNSEPTTKEGLHRLALALKGAKGILLFYSHVVTGKHVTDSTQTMSMSTRDRSRTQFSASQFLVELRMAVLPVVRRLWDSDLIEKGTSQISEKLIDVIRAIANADSELNAHKRSDPMSPPIKPPRKTFKLNAEVLENLEAHTQNYELAAEALFRCNNSHNFALEYCREVTQGEGSRNPVPEGDIALASGANGSRPRTGTSTGTATPDDAAMALDTSVPPPVTQTLHRLFGQSELPESSSASRESPTPVVSQDPAGEESSASLESITVDDLNEEREAIRENLIDRCLDVVNAHGEVTFEIAELITTVVNKSADPGQLRKSVGETLVVALMSFASEEDPKTVGKKIAAYAHLLALMLRDKPFYVAAVEELKDNDNLGTLLSFVKLSSSHSAEDPSPWVSQILLVIELLLSEDAKPAKTKWTAPKDETEEIEKPVLEMVDPAVPQEQREQLMEAILDILPRIGKDESLALSVLRILVILTRTRSMAQCMGEKKNIQRLFVMAKQLAGASSTRIQSPLMIILRHIIEDDETVKQIMRMDIKSYFEHSRTGRNIDHAIYIRALTHTALRNPELFVEMTNEMVKYNRWSYNSPDAPSRHSGLVLKENTPEPPIKSPDDSVQPAVKATEDLSIQDIKLSTEAGDTEMPDAPKAVVVESKMPIVENPDGVIHFLLCELLNYRDVEDKEPGGATSTATEKEKEQVLTIGDISMGGTSMPSTAPADPTSQKNAKAGKASSKQDFKAEEHPIYIYRCFILQCLTELLSSYNRTKVEFINFKRSLPPQAMTPSKPRSSVVNYLLFDLIPVGTLDHAETPSLRKKLVTSSWADSVLTALLSKTGEQPVDKQKDPYDSDNEPDLLFVRRFVLENILKAYKEASFSTTEPLDVKYSRMLALADLMNHIMSGKENMSISDTANVSVSQKQLRRIMFEKNYVAALTASIADMDLNFPGTKRAIKYILRPLKTLTSTAVALSELELISSHAGQSEEDEIESATSVSDLDDDREETPDLFRNSTLGMFEPGRDEDSSSESDDEDEDMYEAEYDEEMEYEEDIGADEDNISDEEEEIEGIGPIEGLSGDHGVDVEVIMGDEDDDDDEDDDEGSSDEDEDHDSEDDDGRVEIIDEAGNIQQLGDEDDIGEWESDEDDEEVDEEDYEGEEADQEEARARGIEDVDGALGHLLRSFGGPDGPAADLINHIGAADLAADDDVPLVGEYIEDMDEDEDDDDQDDIDEEEFMFDHYPLEAAGPMPWGDDAEPPVVVHRRPRYGLPPFPIFAGGRDPLGGTLNPRVEDASATLSSLIERLGEIRAHFHRLEQQRNTLQALLQMRETNRDAVPEYRHRSMPPHYRSHRSQARAADDGVNPLLQRGAAAATGREASGRQPTAGHWIQTMGQGADVMDIGFGRPAHGNPFSAAVIDEVFRSLPALPGHLARHGGALQFHITTGSQDQLPRDLQLMISGRPPRGFETRRDAAEPGSAAFFTPQSTTVRWQEEGKLLFGTNNLERAGDLANAIQSVLVPPAIEADKLVKAAEAERKRQVAEELKKREEEERIARESKEAEEKLAREKKEAEARETAEREAAEARAAGNSTVDNETQEGIFSTAPEAMDGVETQATEPEEVAPPADRPRVTTMIRGSPVDITDLGIDADFLAELPDEIREEVITATVAERRSQAAASGAQPTDIDQEFLDALPDDIRREIIQQEAQDRRRRQQNESRLAMAAAEDGNPINEMDAASILATLDPALRAQVLMEQDEDVLSMLPQEVADQARAAMRNHGRPPVPRTRIAARPMARSLPLQPRSGERDANLSRPARRPTVQMLDKSGIATLLRLMFISQQGSLRNTLNIVLQNVSMNRHNRNEILSTLLHILQDGSVDVSTVERSFTQLSLRAKQPKETQPKTPVQLKRTLTGSTTLTPTITSEASPLLLVQQCLTALVYLTQVNLHVPAFFLTEHDSSSSLKRNLSRKGKGKDVKASKYALNSLLALLDRDVIMESSQVMEALSTLLNMVTTPLQHLQRRQREAEEANNTEDTTTENAPVTEATASADQQPADTTEPVTTEVAPPQTETETAEASTTSNPGELAQVEKEPEKKQRHVTPPVVPEHNLQLVINIFVARECSSKTFRETLSTIKNLSAIPGAKAVFGKELISKAQALGEVILLDLEELLPQIQEATTGTEIQGVALAKFSPGGSDQNKLLLVLTALDHLFDPKRDKKDKSTDTDTDGESSQKQDLLSSLYENSTFGPMWEKLSACLSSIRQREHMMNVATILLPLIEALMVVCKNTTLKDAPLARSQLGKEMMLTSPPPESRMESLFFTFTEEHRKILNDLVRHTPKLMSGTFSLLVKNPKVLEFDNKRNYFSRSIHSKVPNSRQSFPPLQLSVRRDQVFHDSFKSLYFQTGDQMKYGKLSIRFHGEEGVDAGGVTREWFQVLSRQMFDPGYALFIPVSSDRTTFHPNQLSSINEEHLMFFKFIGRIIGKALYEGRVLDCHFSRAVYKRILGKAVSVKDMESLDPDYYKSLVWMLENDITDIITETFSVDNDKFGVVETIDFIPEGRTIAVTEDNKHEYVRLMVEWRLTGSVKDQLDEFLKGFHEIIPAELVSIFNEQELELLISGLPEIDVDDWKSNTELHNYSASSPQIQWFWRAVRSYDKEERAKLLQFVTGTSKVPLNGFKELEGMNGFSRFNIHRDYGNKDRLPSSHTCFNQLDLPEYESYEALRQQVLTAITAGSEYFGFA